MRLTRHFRETVSTRAARDPAFAKALAEEAEMLFRKGDTRIARRILKNGRLTGHPAGATYVKSEPRQLTR